MENVKETQRKKILEYLMEHPDGITSLEAIYKFSDHPITRLSAIIHSLRKKGYPIEKTMEKSSSKTRYARYYLVDEKEDEQ